jgi:hypothetical protein
MTTHNFTMSDVDLKKLAIKRNTRLDDVLMFKDFLQQPKVGNFIINLDIDSRGGTHYISVISLHDKIYLFDPFGFCPEKEFIEKVTGKKVYYSNVKMQNINQSCCGIYCLLFLSEAENVKNEKQFNDSIEELKCYKIMPPKKKTNSSDDK